MHRSTSTFAAPAITSSPTIRPIAAPTPGVLARECGESQYIGASAKQLFNLWMSWHGDCTSGPPTGSGARVTRCFPGTPSWPGWAFFPTRARCNVAPKGPENAYRMKRYRRPARSQRTQLPRSPRGARGHSTPPQRRQPAGLLLVSAPESSPMPEFSGLDADAIRRDVLSGQTSRGLSRTRALGPPLSTDSFRRPPWCGIWAASTAARRSTRCSRRRKLTARYSTTKP